MHCASEGIRAVWGKSCHAPSEERQRATVTTQPTTVKTLEPGLPQDGRRAVGFPLHPYLGIEVLCYSRGTPEGTATGCKLKGETWGVTVYGATVVAGQASFWWGKSNKSAFSLFNRLLN